MPTIGVICHYDDSYQSFEHCISCHERRNESDPARNCGAPVMALKSMRDNSKYRSDAGVSASTLLSCPRAVAIEQVHDLYETPISGYNKFRGTAVHAMFEMDPDPPEWVVRERRITRSIKLKDGTDFYVTGKPDEVDTKHGVLIDYKSKAKVPKQPDPRHELQFNIYAWLLRHGAYLDTGEVVNVDIQVIGAHYVTFETKPETAWLKMSYPVHDDAVMSAWIWERSQKLYNWQQTGVIPEHTPLRDVEGRELPTYWKCECERYEAQLRDRGVDVE